MDHDNPYRAPAARIAEEAIDPALAGRGRRLAAAAVDFLIMLVVTLPVMYLGGYLDQVIASAQGGPPTPLTTDLAWSVIGVGLFLLVQGWPLAAAGQTWGKRALGLRIVDLEGRRPPFLRLVVLRYLMLDAAAMVPIAGAVVGAANILLIFRRDRRCGHDLIAGTRVVRAR